MVTLKLGLKNKGQAIGSVITILVIVLVGLTVVFSTVSTTLHTATNTFHVANDTLGDFNVSKSIALQGFADQSGEVFTVLMSDLAIYNDSDCSTGVLTQGTHYTVLGNGTSNVIINITDASSPTNNTCGVYTFTDSSYVEDSTARLIVGFLPLIIAVVILVAIAAFIA